MNIENKIGEIDDVLLEMVELWNRLAELQSEMDRRLKEVRTHFTPRLATLAFDNHMKCHGRLHRSRRS